MLGAIIGDIVGSVYENNNIKTTDFTLFGDKCKFTDDTVMTFAVAEALMDGGKAENYTAAMKKYGALYPNEKFFPHMGYGTRFLSWLKSGDSKPYESYGNGSAMRVSPVAWWYKTLHKVEKAAKTSAAVTHNHREGIKGAQAAAAAIFLARSGESKDDIRNYIEEKYKYNLHRTLDEIRPAYKFDESCQGTVPEAIIAFLESTGFEDAIRKAVSLGGDSDTLAAITGSIAEAAYGVPEEIKTKALSMLDGTLSAILKRWEKTAPKDLSNKVAKVCERLFPYIAHFDKRPQIVVEDPDDNYIYDNKTDEFVHVFYECKCYLPYERILIDYEVADKVLCYCQEVKHVIPSANMELLWAILTVYLRSGRICWDAFPWAVEQGYIADILKRLRELHGVYYPKSAT